MIAAILKNKTARICLSCMRGLIIADNTINESQKIYCLDCGTEHIIKIAKNGSVKVQKNNKKCNKEKLEQLNKDNLEFLIDYSIAIASYIEKIQTKRRKGVFNDEK